jgi:hypothetical protein
MRLTQRKLLGIFGEFDPVLMAIYKERSQAGRVGEEAIKEGLVELNSEFVKTSAANDNLTIKGTRPWRFYHLTPAIFYSSLDTKTLQALADRRCRSLASIFEFHL